MAVAISLPPSFPFSFRGGGAQSEGFPKMVSLSESLVSLTQASKLLPARRKGKRPNVATLYRWSTAGCKGVVLETTQVGGTRCTSREALGRFFDRLSAQSSVVTSAPAPLPARVNRRDVERAERVLDAAGI
jgi:hypothetical protein